MRKSQRRVENESRSSSKRRRKWTTEKKAELVTKAKAMRASGQPWREISVKLGVCEGLLHQWTRQFPDSNERKRRSRPRRGLRTQTRAKKDEVGFVEVEMPSGNVGSGGSDCVEVDLGDLRIRFANGVEPAYVGALCMELKAKC